MHISHRGWLLAEFTLPRKVHFFSFSFVLLRRSGLFLVRILWYCKPFGYVRCARLGARTSTLKSYRKYRNDKTAQKCKSIGVDTGDCCDCLLIARTNWLLVAVKLIIVHECTTFSKRNNLRWTSHTQRTRIATLCPWMWRTFAQSVELDLDIAFVVVNKETFLCRRKREWISTAFEEWSLRTIANIIQVASSRGWKIQLWIHTVLVLAVRQWAHWQWVERHSVRFIEINSPNHSPFDKQSAFLFILFFFFSFHTLIARPKSGKMREITFFPHEELTLWSLSTIAITALKFTTSCCSWNDPQWARQRSNSAGNQINIIC